MASGDRRSSAGDTLANLLLDAPEPVPFDDLERQSAEVAGVAEVAGWVGNAVDEGLVEDVPGGDGRRRFRLRRRGEVVLTKNRRATDG
jgi:hypothetical protein